MAERYRVRGLVSEQAIREGALVVAVDGCVVGGCVEAHDTEGWARVRLQRPDPKLDDVVTMLGNVRVYDLTQLMGWEGM